MNWGLEVFTGLVILVLINNIVLQIDYVISTSEVNLQLFITLTCKLIISCENTIVNSFRFQVVRSQVCIKSDNTLDSLHSGNNDRGLRPWSLFSQNGANLGYYPYHKLLVLLMTSRFYCFRVPLYLTNQPACGIISQRCGSSVHDYLNLHALVLEIPPSTQFRSYHLSQHWRVIHFYIYGWFNKDKNSMVSKR